MKLLVQSVGCVHMYISMTKQSEELTVGVPEIFVAVSWGRVGPALEVVAAGSRDMVVTAGS